MRVLPDTNAIAALRLGNPKVLRVLEGADEVLLSFVVLGELLYGFRNGRLEKENMDFIDSFLTEQRVHVLPAGTETARAYAGLRLILKRLGKPIPTNDLWIAAQVVESGSVLLSDDSHFDVLTGIRRESLL